MRLRRSEFAGALIFRRPGGRELRVLADALRTETIGGALLLAATVTALILANIAPSKALVPVAGAVRGMVLPRSSTWSSSSRAWSPGRPSASSPAPT
jgi:hypothetical protein